MKFAAIVSTIAFIASPLQAASQGTDPKTCAAIDSDPARLACYDSIHRSASAAETSPMVAACEEKLTAQLKSPSSYRRIKVSGYEEDLAVDAYKDRELIKIRDTYDANTAVLMRALLNQKIEALEKAASKPTMFTRVIEYDAQNGFGALIRGRALCTFMSGDGQESGAVKSTVSVSP